MTGLSAVAILNAHKRDIVVKRAAEPGWIACDIVARIVGSITDIATSWFITTIEYLHIRIWGMRIDICPQQRDSHTV